MTIKEAETRTGLTRSNIRFYEKEKLIVPSRSRQNGYRNYSQSDIEAIQKIACLRTLGISIEDIRCIISGKASLHEILEKQHAVLSRQISSLNQAKILCSQMLRTEGICYETFHPKQYVPNLQNYWKDSQMLLRMDTVRFFFYWSSFFTWALITAACIAASLWSYAKLPPEIPVQWHGSTVSSMADKNLIFAYPASCLAVRYLLRPCIYAKMQLKNSYGRQISEYLSNYLCFLALSIELFTIFYLYGLAENIAVLFFADTAVLAGMLAAGIWKMNRKSLPGFHG